MVFNSSEKGTETTKTNLVYNYKTHTILGGELQGNDRDGYIAALSSTPEHEFYVMSGGTTDTDDAKDTKRYNATYLFLSKPVHYKKDSGFLGELIIEHMDKYNNKAYVVYPLKQYGSMIVSRGETEVDAIMLQKGKKDNTKYSLTLNDMIPRQEKCYQYDNVYVFHNPITIAYTKPTTPEGILEQREGITGNKSRLTEPNKKAFNIIPKQNISRQKEDDIYIDCNPTGASQQELDTYEIPINSRMTKDLSELRLKEMIINFFMFLVLVVICYFVVPVAYKLTVIRLILVGFIAPIVENDTKDGTKGKLVLHSIRKLIDVLLLVFSVVIFSLLFTTSPASGIIFGVGIVLSSLIIVDKMKLPEYNTYTKADGTTSDMYLQETEVNGNYKSQPSAPFTLQSFNPVATRVFEFATSIASVAGILIYVLTARYAFKIKDGNKLALGSLMVLLITVTLMTMIRLNVIENRPNGRINLDKDHKVFVDAVTDMLNQKLLAAGGE